jgi:glutaminyl-peptide cyclotransferase
MSTYRSNLTSISLFVLLDLLGASGPRIPSYFPTTHWAYQHMGNLEARLRALRLMKSSPNHATKNPPNGRPVREPLFLVDKDKSNQDMFIGGFVEDDHVPFMQRGVEILHMIPTPFPMVWHTSLDDGEHLDIPTVEDWATIVTAFAAEWLDLEGYMPKSNLNLKREEDSGGGTFDKDEL